MLNQILREKIEFAEIRMMYDSKIALNNSSIKKEVRKYIQGLRKKFGKNEQDLLANREKEYGKAVGGWYKAQVLAAEKRLFDINKGIPEDSKGAWRSIEFELIFNNEKALQEFVGLTRLSDVSKFLTIKNDGSIKLKEGDIEGIPREVVVSYKTGQENIVRKVSRFLRGRAYVNNTCGTHVHFDMRNADEATATLYANRIVRCLQALKALLPKSRRENKFCKEPVNTFKDRGRPEDRYAFVNLQSYNKYRSLEIRGHSGTIIAEKILNWIKICDTIMAERIAFKSKEITTSEQLIKIYKFDKDDPILAKYITERSAYFADSPEIRDEGEIICPPIEVQVKPLGVTSIKAQPPKLRTASWSNYNATNAWEPRPVNFPNDLTAIDAPPAPTIPLVGPLGYMPLCGELNCTDAACRPARVEINSDLEFDNDEGA